MPKIVDAGGICAILPHAAGISPGELTDKMKISIDEINSAGIRAQARLNGVTEIELLGDNGETGDDLLTAYQVGNVRVIDTNGDPVWEESDPEAFAELMEQIA